MIRSPSVVQPLHAPPLVSNDPLLSLRRPICGSVPGLTCFLSSPKPIYHLFIDTSISTPLERNTMQPNHYDLLGQVRNESRSMTRDDYQPLHENALQSRSPSGAAPSRTEGMSIYSSLPSRCSGSLCFGFMALIMYILWPTFKPLLLLPCTHFAIT